MPAEKSRLQEILLPIYLFLVSLIALIILTINAGRLVHLGLQKWVFPVSEARWGDLDFQRENCERTGFSVGAPFDEEAEKPTATQVKKCVERIETRAKEQLRDEENRTLAEAIAFALVAFPVWAGHYRRALGKKGCLFSRKS